MSKKRGLCPRNPLNPRVLTTAATGSSRRDRGRPDRDEREAVYAQPRRRAALRKLGRAAIPLIRRHVRPATTDTSGVGGLWRHRGHGMMRVEGGDLMQLRMGRGRGRGARARGRLLSGAGDVGSGCRRGRLGRRVARPAQRATRAGRARAFRAAESPPLGAAVPRATNHFQRVTAGREQRRST
jgi:hypothetical protein